MFDVLVVGCGLSGCVLAERFAKVKNYKVLIIDKRDHIGGNCYDYIHKQTNILVSKYGPHFFHTDDDEVWNYVQIFSEWVPYEHKVVAFVDDKYVPVPVNINTVNQIFNLKLTTSKQMDQWLKKNQIQYNKIENSQQMACSLVGKELYNKIFKNYTKKQWDKYPSELSPQVCARIPVRNNHDNRYFTDKYQAVPKNGYTEFIKNMIEHENISVKLDTNFFDLDPVFYKDKIIIFTGPIDHYFSGKGLEKLEYRSLIFENEVYKNVGYFQSHTTVNYPDLSVPYTRITEYKHCYPVKTEDTVITKEYSCKDGEPYYPVLNEKNLKLFEKYKQLASETKDVHFVGRLANFKYFNMDQAIKNSLDYFKNNFC